MFRNLSAPSVVRGERERERGQRFVRLEALKQRFDGRE